MNPSQDAFSDALEMLAHYIDNVATSARDGDVSDDLYNDYPDGDAYHHENHVDRSYDLTEAAAILDALADDEETDEGLWQGLAPRDAISAQAAYTYGNAVLSRWQALIRELNTDYLDQMNASEDRREGIARLFVLLTCHHVPRDGIGEIGQRMAHESLADLSQDDLDTVQVYADWLDDHNLSSLAADLRAAVALATVPE